MKANVFLTIIGAVVGCLIGYLAYYVAEGDQNDMVCGIGSAICFIATLCPLIGWQFESGKLGTNIRMMTLIFFVVFLISNFCFAGNTKPSDMSSFVFQIRFRVKDGVCTSRGFRIIPIRISSRTSRNDFIPTPYTSGANIDSVLTTLRSNGKKLEYAVENYPLDWE